MTRVEKELSRLRIDASLNDFAVRCFRDIADQDYIAARMAWRHSLYPQFHWSALQAIEKYLKCILLLNRVPAKNLRHDLDKALQLTSKLPFDIELSASSRELIQHLDRFGRWRYLESSYYVYGPKLVQLDRTVWEVRRYCQRLDVEIELPDGRTKNLLGVKLAAIHLEQGADKRRLKLSGGLLEKIVANREHPARAPLIWKNLFYGLSKRSQVQMKTTFHATNAPLTLHPEILDEVLKYVFLPKEVVKAYREEVRGGSGDGSTPPDDG